MSKIFNLTNNLLQIPFLSPQQEYSLFRKRFEKTELGRIYRSLPWKSLYGCVKNKRRRRKRGRKSFFDLHGKLALMFLKHYLVCSDRQLLERLNTDYTLQFFCHIYIRPDQSLTDFKIISKIRVELSYRIDWEAFQLALGRHWKGLMSHPHIGMIDATCYETNMRYPTDAKLLWECCEWVYAQMKGICKYAKVRMPRNKFAEQKTKQLVYQKRRKRSYKMTRRRKRSLLYLLNKLLRQLEDIENQMDAKQLRLPSKYFERIKTIRKILEQQQLLFTAHKVSNRIVSIAKSYIRPIVRGKETKRVEFGAKVNTLQIDGLNFIEHISFDAFNESTRLQSSVHLQRKITGKCTHMAADQIYATNANRKYCSQNHIYTSFVRKGKAGKLEDQRFKMQQVLSKQRATQLEGSFGTQKNHYLLHRIKARCQSTEVLWIYFGVHTANACKVARKLINQDRRVA